MKKGKKTAKRAGSSRSAPKRKTKAKKPKHSAQAKQKQPEETMDRKALKVVVSQLKGMDVDIKVLKSDTDDQLQKKVNEALQQLPSGEVVKTLEKVVPDKLITVLKRDCLGIFVDLSDISCVRCPDNQACVTTFLKNVSGGMVGLEKAMPEAPKEEPPAKLAKVTKYKSKRLVFIRDVKNPNPKGDPYHDTIARVLKDQPETLGELRSIIEDDFEIDSDEDFMKYVTALRDPKEGVIKLNVDLSEKNRAELREAGYDV